MSRGAEAQLARNDGFQAAIAPGDPITGVVGNLHRIEIHCAPENHRSRAIPERLGFREEATLRETELVCGRWLDSVVYGLLAEEWGEKKERRPT